MVSWIVFTVAFFTITSMVYIYLTRKSHTKLDDFLTARHHLSTIPATATVLASIMGAWVLFTPAEVATWGGIAAFGGYALAQAVAVMLFAIFGVRMRKIAPKGSTLFEFVFYRYGKGMYALVLLVGVFYMAVFLAAELTGIALAANIVAGIPLWMTALIVGGGTLIYTTYGGIRASIFTDTIQAAIILPTILIAFGAAAYFLGGLGEITNEVRQINPELLNFGNIGGLQFAAVMGISVIAANMFNQGFWSRVYSCRSDKTVIRSFLTAGILVIPVMILAGSFGLMAVSRGILQTPSAALFEVVLTTTPGWVISVVTILAISLVMSSADTMVSAIAAVFTVDIARFNPDIDSSKLQGYARIITAVISGMAIVVATQGYSVLYLFLIADLACAAAVFPTFFGMYSQRFQGWAGILATAGGIAAGIPFFPGPSIQGGNLLYSFSLALAVSTLISLVLERTSKVEISFETLSGKVQDIRS